MSARGGKGGKFPPPHAENRVPSRQTKIIQNIKTPGQIHNHKTITNPCARARRKQGWKPSTFPPLFHPEATA